MIYAHTLTFPEVLASKEAVVNLQGILVGGPDKKTIDDWSKWVQWQRAIQFASRTPGVVPPRVMDYFQKTKHLASAPKVGDQNILQSGPIDRSLIAKEESPVAKPFRLTWSWTALQTFIQCPCCWAAKYFYKTAREAESEAMRWGNVVHKAAENAALGKASASELKILSDLKADKYIRVIEKMKAAGAEVHVEKEMCFDRKLQFSTWKAWDTVWYRGKADVIIVNGNKLSVWDYKTGTVKPEVRQLDLMCAFAALYFPQAEIFDGKLLFLKHDKIEGLEKPLTRAELKPILLSVLQDVKRMQEAVDAETFVARKSGLCRPNGKGYMGCANKDCPHAQ